MWPYLGCVFLSFIFSSHYLIAKVLLNEGMSPLALSSWRGVVGGLVLLILFRKKMSIALIRTNFRDILIIAGLGFFLNQLFFMKGLQLTSPLHAALISNMIPVVTLLVAFLFGLEKLTLRRSLGIVISFCLVSYLLWDPTKSLQGSLQGNLYIFINVVFFCVSFVWGKRKLQEGFPFQILTGLMLLIGGLSLGLIALKDHGSVIHVISLSSKNLYMLLFEILITTSFAYVLNPWILSKLKASTVNFFIYLQPLFTALLLYVFEDRAPARDFYWIMAGLFLSGALILFKDREA